MFARWVLAAIATALVSGKICDKNMKGGTEECELFKEFEFEFNKTYESEEKRLEHYVYFLENLNHVKKLNNNSAKTLGHLSPLADMSREKFRARNNLSDQWPQIMKEVKMMPKGLLDSEAEANSFDWRTKGAVNEVKDQKQCGSCWAFATVANVEGVYFHQHQRLLSLSEQELVSCDHTDNGCNGGLPANAYQWLITKHRGLELESDYEYDAADEACTLVKSKQRVFVHDFMRVPPQSEGQMTRVLVKYGPLSIGLNADLLQMYTGGVMDPDEMDCDPDMLDHGVAIVAFGVDDGMKYWTIRNSWGNMWGEEGYFRISRGKGTCGVDKMVTTATLASDRPYENGAVKDKGEQEQTQQLEEKEMLA